MSRNTALFNFIGGLINNTRLFYVRLWTGLKTKTGLSTEALVCALPISAGVYRIGEIANRPTSGAWRAGGRAEDRGQRAENAEERPRRARHENRVLF